MSRFKVVRGVVQYKRKRYKAGELLPENFSEHDRRHNAWPHRILEISDEEASKLIPEEVPEEVHQATDSIPPQVTGAVVEAAPKTDVQVAAKATIQPQNLSEGNNVAANNPASPKNISGAGVPLNKSVNVTSTHTSNIR